MTDGSGARMAFLLQPSGLETAAPRISPLTEAILVHLRSRDNLVDVIVPESGPLDIADLRPRHDLYILKSETPLALSVAGALTVAGATVVNSFRACYLTRDKIAATAVLAAAGVPVPPSWTTGRPPLLSPLLADGPLWVKPPLGREGLGVRRLAGRADLDSEAPPVDAHGLSLPLFAQREVPTGGRDLKVFAVGSDLWATSRPFPARTLEEKVGTPVALSPEVRTAALTCGRALGLELFGVDFLTAADQFFVVDVNAFPGYKGVPEAAQAVAEYLARVAERARKASHG
jgi:ribosomal protein S6--L-glutamate ligase